MQPFIGEIRMFGGNFAPRSWANCDGQLLAINSNQALFSLLGTTYGGDGRTTFGLPDLRGRAPMHTGNGPGLTSRSQGQRSGSETNTMNILQMPAHNHLVETSGAKVAIKVHKAPNDQESSDPADGILCDSNNDLFTTKPADASYNNGDGGTIEGLTVGNTGGQQPINNMQPFLVVRFIIALQGIFPSRS